MTQGVKLGPPVVKRGVSGVNSPVLTAGEAERGGESGFVHSGDQKSCGGHLRVAGSKPQLLVVLVELGWPETAPATTLAVAGVRVMMNPRLRSTVRLVVRCYGFLRVR